MIKILNYKYKNKIYMMILKIIIFIFIFLKHVKILYIHYKICIEVAHCFGNTTCCIGLPITKLGLKIHMNY